MKPKFREKMKSWMKKRMSFRFHMSIIMSSTIFLGMVSNFVLLNVIGISNPTLRYPLTVLFSYAWFLLFIRIYIKSILTKSSAKESVLDISDITPDIPTSIDTGNPTWIGGGGAFSGGGATGNWGQGEMVSSLAKDTVAEAAGSTVSSIVDDEGGAIIVFVIGGILAAVVFGSGAYFIWHSPEILSECLLQVMLVSGMRKRMKEFSEQEWLTHMFKVTKWPLVTVLVVGLLCGVVLRSFCPEAHGLKDYKTRCLKGQVKV